ncbi:MAG: YdcF family protein [Chloroflexi bacterium]|nr:YdcF family protein [Chloroflexota bacterium]
MRLAIRIVVLLGSLAILATAVPGGWVFLQHQGKIYGRVQDAPSAPVAIVFGAALRPDGEPSLMLADRVDAAVELYRAGKVQRILMTGDNRSPYHDEVTAMKRYAIERGVPADVIDLDGAGLRTYDSCYRASTIFGIDEAILVTQGYHLPRALFLARSFGINAVGLKAGRDDYPNQDYYDLREAAADIVSWYEVNFIHPLPFGLTER